MFEIVRDVARGTRSDVRAQLEELLSSRPSSQGLAVASSIDLGTLDQDESLLLVQVLEKQIAFLTGRQLTAIAQVAGPAPGAGSGSEDWVREEVAISLGLSPAAAHRRITLARRLASVLPATAKALLRGDIGFLHALNMSEKTAVLSDEDAAVVEMAVLLKSRDRTLGEFCNDIKWNVTKVDPASAQQRHDRTVAGRRVELHFDDDATATLVASGLPAVDAQAVFNALTARGRQMGADDPRTMDQRRTDTLVEWGYAALADPNLPKEHSRRPNVQITVDLPTLLGLADNPAELDGYGPIPPELARELARDGVWRRLITDPTTGQLLDYGRTTYKPPQALVDFVSARDKCCRFPGCVRRARLCDHDHGMPFSQGGTTCAENVCCLCERHHRLKHEAGWKLELHPGAGVTWTTPAGQKYYQPPPPILE